MPSGVAQQRPGLLGRKVSAVRAPDALDASLMPTRATQRERHFLRVRRYKHGSSCRHLISRRALFTHGGSEAAQLEVHQCASAASTSVRKSTLGSRSLVASTGRWALISLIERRSSFPRLTATAASTRPLFR